jgi:hypothetical protein
VNYSLESYLCYVGYDVKCMQGSTKKILSQLAAVTGAKVQIVPIPLPVLSREDVISRISNALAIGNIKLVVLDHITSNTAMILPIVEIASICKSHGAVVVIDAAHSLFTMDISLYPREEGSSEAGRAPFTFEKSSFPIQPGQYISDVADVWIGNCHKWLCSPKGAAFMWISPKISHRIRPAIISHGFQLGQQQHQSDGEDFTFLSLDRGSSAPDKLLSGFIWDGCRDYSALLTIPSILKFWKNFSSVDKRLNRHDRIPVVLFLQCQLSIECTVNLQNIFSTFCHILEGINSTDWKQVFGWYGWMQSVLA